MMEPPFYRRLGEQKKLGDAHDRPILVVVEVKGRLIVLRQLGQRGVEMRVFALLRVLLRRVRGQGRALRQNEIVHLGRLDGLAAPLPRADPPRAMARDGIEPARKLSRILQLRQGFVGQQERLLRHVFRRLPRPKRLLRHKDHCAAKPAHERIERLHVAQQRADDKLFIPDWRIGTVLIHRLIRSCIQETGAQGSDRSC